MHTILPTREMALEINNAANAFFQEKGVKVNLKPEEAHALAIAAVDETLFNSVKWAADSYPVREIWDRVLERDSPIFHSQEDYVDFVIDLTGSVINPIKERVRGMIKIAFDIKQEDRGWVVWHTLPLGGDLVVEMGGDFRVLDWEMKVKEGTITPPKG